MKILVTGMSGLIGTALRRLRRSTAPRIIGPEGRRYRVGELARLAETR